MLGVSSHLFESIHVTNSTAEASDKGLEKYFSRAPNRYAKNSNTDKNTFHETMSSLRLWEQIKTQLQFTIIIVL